MRKFLRRYWFLMLILLGMGIAVWGYPVVWCFINAEAGIGALLYYGYSKSQAFLYGCFAGNTEALIWYFWMGKKIRKEKQALAKLITNEKEEAKRQGIDKPLAAIWRHIRSRVENPERYQQYWFYKVCVRIRHYTVLGFPITPILYIFLTLTCVIPVLMFGAIAFVHFNRIRWGLVAILLGNTGKMAFAAYGVWPMIF